MRDCRIAGLCAFGTRFWVQKNGFNWKEFLEAGLDLEMVEAIGDPLAMKATKVARGRQ